MFLWWKQHINTTYGKFLSEGLWSLFTPIVFNSFSTSCFRPYHSIHIPTPRMSFFGETTIFHPFNLFGTCYPYHFDKSGNVLRFHYEFNFFFLFSSPSQYNITLFYLSLLIYLYHCQIIFINSQRSPFLRVLTNTHIHE